MLTKVLMITVGAFGFKAECWNAVKTEEHSKFRHQVYKITGNIKKKRKTFLSYF